MLCIHNIGT